MSPTLNWRIQYLLGSVSAYKLQDQQGDACLSATRLGDQLVLEPDDCNAKHKFICASDIKRNSGDKTAKSNLPNKPINASTSLPAILTTSEVLIARPVASAVGTDTVLIIVACCSVVVGGGGGVVIAIVIYKRKRDSIKDCKKHVTPQPSLNTCVTNNSMADVPESDYETVDETNLVLTKSDAATVPPGTLLNLTASGGTLDTNTPQDKQTRHILTRKNNLELCENIPLSKKALNNRNKDDKDTIASMSDEYNVLSFNNPARAARKREDSEAHVYDHMPAVRNGQRSDEKPRNESTKYDQNEYDTTESVHVLLHGDYATSRSLRKADYGECDTSQSVQTMLRSNQQSDDT